MIGQIIGRSLFWGWNGEVGGKHREVALHAVKESLFVSLFF